MSVTIDYKNTIVVEGSCALKLFCDIFNGKRMVSTSFTNITFPCIIKIPYGLLKKMVDLCHEKIKWNESCIQVLKKGYELEKKQKRKQIYSNSIKLFEKNKQMLKIRLDYFETFYLKFFKHLHSQYSFLLNSSVWIRLVESKDSSAFKDAENEMAYFRTIGLYEYSSAAENLEYNIRIQSQNFLDSKIAGHAEYVTPMLYGNETSFYKVLKDKDNVVDIK